MSGQKNIVLGVTGSIAAYKSCDIVRRFREKGFKVSVVLTKSAENFITPLTLSSLSGNKVYSGEFQEDQKAWKMPHIALAKEADVLLIAPATANIIAKIANGLADDLLTCIALATKAKMVIAPAMNTEMYEHKIVQGNCEKLRDIGVEFIEPVDGNLACGDIGRGHIADIDQIVNAVEQII